MSYSNKNFMDMHVSRETYDATLRNTVNAYYQHEMNNPSVSNEDAISQTAQVAENYHNAMAEFDVAQSVSSEEGALASNSVSTGESYSDGVDSGVDTGGIDGGADGGVGM